ncbi:ribosomal protein L5 domain-containing protein [Phlyctochytrium arcticum]|nr:ribosomal protein L5 domain-containing protein [Phlyctochytrium arcticum]
MDLESCRNSQQNRHYIGKTHKMRGRISAQAWVGRVAPWRTTSLSKRCSIVAARSASSAIQSTNIPQDSTTPPPISRPRLEEHYYNTLLEDLLVLTYDHSSPTASLEHLSSNKEWSRSLPNHPLEKLYSKPIERLPTFPHSETTTNLLSRENAVVKTQKLKQKFRVGFRNPIDYTPVSKEDLEAREPAPPPKPYAPLPSRMPVPSKVVLRIYSKAAVQNKTILLSAIMSLQAITGVRAHPLFAETGDAAAKIREGMPVGAICTLTGPAMYTFLDKTIQTVLPRLREWQGVNPVSSNLLDDSNPGTLAFNLPAAAIGLYPDIEPHFDMYPRLFDTDIIIQTTAPTEREAVLCLSGFQMPFLNKREVLTEEEVESSDPWAKFRKPKTREERKAMAEKKKASGGAFAAAAKAAQK